MVVWPELCLPVGTGRKFPHLVPSSELENVLGEAEALSGCFIACGFPDWCLDVVKGGGWIGWVTEVKGQLVLWALLTH